MSADFQGGGNCVVGRSALATFGDGLVEAVSDQTFEQIAASEPPAIQGTVKMVTETSRPIAEVAREIRVKEGTLGNWVNKYRAEHADDEPPLRVSERARLRELEKEVRELRMKAEFLGKAAAFFAQEYR